MKKAIYISILFPPALSCAKVGPDDSEDATLDRDGEGAGEIYWEDVVLPDGPEFGLGSKDGWSLSQDAMNIDMSCAIPNACSGCAPLSGEPGTKCDTCDGKWECIGPNTVECQGGCDSVGCSDGQREGFTNMTTFPEIAGCAGGWTIAGIINPESGSAIPPNCGRMSGDDSFNPEGWECSAADLCANGWRICSSARDVSERTKGWTKGCGADADWPPGAFFAAAVSGTGDNECKLGVNDIFGCGSAGDGADAGTCAPLTKYSDDKCDALPSTWDCGNGYLTTNLTEAKDVKKTGPEGGGVLCCKERR